MYPPTVYPELPGVYDSDVLGTKFHLDPNSNHVCVQRNIPLMSSCIQSWDMVLKLLLSVKEKHNIRHSSLSLFKFFRAESGILPDI